jgi:hypothetical protein
VLFLFVYSLVVHIARSKMAAHQACLLGWPAAWVSTPVCLDLIPSLPFLSRSLKLFSAEQSGGGSGYR